MSDETITEYPREEMGVQWDTRLCIHIGECGRAKGELFLGGRKPWCQPDLASTEEVVDVIERCPSGALTYRAKDGNHVETAAAENSVQVSYHGPLFLRGELAIEGAPEDVPGVRFRAALCRCGQSASKPFCDNNHANARFEDFGAVGETGPGLAQRSGPLNVRPAKDGPLLLSGNLQIHASSGRMAWEGDKVALCRCGGSKNKPFCDGSHKTNGFSSG